MRDVKAFCKLLDLSIPDYTHFDYYIEQLSKTEKWKNIKELIFLFEDAEEKYGDLYEYRFKKADEIIQYLKNTRAYNELIYDNLLPDYATTKNFEYSEDKKYISIDIRKANWVVLKKYDPEFAPELGSSYEDFINKFDVPEIFNHSKQLRQFIFGNINPKRQMKAQRVIVQEILEKYSHLNLEIACVKNDEVIYAFDDINQVTEILQTIDNNRFKTKLFSVKRIKDFRINTYLSERGDKLYKEMIGCNGNLFFLYLKKYILEENIDIRDLYFKIDGNIAIWNVDGLKINL